MSRPRALARFARHRDNHRAGTRYSPVGVRPRCSLPEGAVKESLAARSLVAPAQEGVIKLCARTGMIVIPAQAGIHCTSAQPVQGEQDRRNRVSKLRFAARWIPVCAGMTWPAFVRSRSEPGTASTNWIISSIVGKTVSLLLSGSSIVLSSQRTARAQEA
jgi:hypothetical protein